MLLKLPFLGFLTRLSYSVFEVAILLSLIVILFALISHLKKYLTFKIKFITFILTSEFKQIEYTLYFHQREHRFNGKNTNLIDRR